VHISTVNLKGNQGKLRKEEEEEEEEGREKGRK
jgi:hypothetical protein